ncbi:MAG: diaminopimelate epimerase [Candidatus Zixiibacteriota bacterium]|nr:MAG: diaminopimelate epimerase [candidate division Zixibacteria bacterium]
MPVAFHKYHALLNDFIVVDLRKSRVARTRLRSLAVKMCHRRTGVGADGLVCLSSRRNADARIDIFNSDGSWAEKSGNGLRIAAVHCHLHSGRRRKRKFLFQTASSLDRVSLVRRDGDSYLVKTELGRPTFEARQVPVKSRRRFVINAPIRVGGVDFPVTCLSVGNPHTVLFVDDFEFDWQAVGAAIEKHRSFPNRTNVEFVKVVNRRKVKVADWERGAGATGSSGTGAAAAVAAGVMLGLLDRRCEVLFETGSLMIDWPESPGVIQLTGPAQFIASGEYEF